MAWTFQLFFMTFFVTCFAMADHHFHDGTFAGKGLKTYADGTTKTYSLEVTFGEGKIAFQYQLPSGPVGYELELAYEKIGFFKVADIGQGYCGPTFCHFSVNLENNTIEEWSFLFQGDHRKKFGSIKGPTVQAFWDEELDRK